MPSGIYCCSCAWSYLWACFFLLPSNCLKATSCNYLIRGDGHCSMWDWAIVIFIFPPGTLLCYHPKHGAPSDTALLAGEGLARLQETPKPCSKQRAPRRDQVPLHCLCSTPCKYFTWNHRLEVSNTSAILYFAQKKHADFAKVLHFVNLSLNKCTWTENYILQSKQPFSFRVSKQSLHFNFSYWM